MKVRRLYLCCFIYLLASASLKGQGSDLAENSAKWHVTIKKNAIASKDSKKNTFLQPNPGFALYFNKENGVNAPYLVYIPKSYDPKKSMPAVVFLHGGVLARDSFQHKDPFIADEPIFSVADALNIIVVFPFGRTGFMWPNNSKALDNIENITKQVKQHYNVDEKKVFLGGISMGGLGTFWFVTHRPQLFDGFFTFSAIPRLSDGPLNFNNITVEKPVYSMYAKDDPGVSFSEVTEIFEKNKTHAPGWHLASVPTGGHRFIYTSLEGKKYVKSIVGSLLNR